MKICSFDVGIKNLSFAVVQDGRLHDWKLVDLKHQAGGDLCLSVVRALDGHPALLQCDVALVEKQPSKNNKMRIVEALIQAYFVIRGVASEDSSIKKAVVYSSKHKLGGESHRGSSGYRERKKLSVTRCKAFLDATGQDDAFVQLFLGSKKQDDLADCLLQALSYEGNATFREISNTPMDTACTIVARRPSALQERRGYTKSNLKWILSRLPHDSPESMAQHIDATKMLKRAVERWYRGDISQALREFNIDLSATVRI